MKHNIKTYHNLKCNECKTKPLYKDLKHNVLFCGVCGLIHENENEPIKLNNSFQVLKLMPLMTRHLFFNSSLLEDL